MITLSIILLFVLMLGALLLFGLVIGLPVLIIVFGDFIVCIAIFVWLIKKLFRNKRN